MKNISTFVGNIFQNVSTFIGNIFRVVHELLEVTTVDESPCTSMIHKDNSVLW